MKLLKPPKLQAGDKVAVVSLSWGGPGTFPHRYEAGKRQLERALNLEVMAMPHTLRDDAWLAQNPQARAEDLMQAFADPSIKGIISSIGGDDSIRLWPYLDLDVIRTHPKILMGYSDTNVTHFACFKAGLVSFYGPAIMAGFAENGGLHDYLLNSVKRTIFSADPIGVIEPNTEGWTVEFLDWANLVNQTKKRTLNPATGWTFLQGEGVVQGPLIGGCLEVLDMLRGTPVWPDRAAWEGAVLFLETSEEAPPPSLVTRFLRVLATMDILPKLSAILFGRPGGNVPLEQFDDYDQAILQVVALEQGLTTLPVITQMDFGHTDPMFVLPYGVMAEVDCHKQQVAIIESAVS